MAMTTRWRCPPLIWWGYFRADASGAGTPTFSSISTAFFHALARFIPRCSHKTSAIWSPTRIIGLSAVNGSCMTIAISCPRMSSQSRGRISTRLRFSRTISPRLTRPGSGIIPMIARPVIDLPQPDSPTTPSVLPRSSERLTPRRMRVVPNETSRSFSSRTGMPRIVARRWFLRRESAPPGQPTSGRSTPRNRPRRSGSASTSRAAGTRSVP